MKNKFIKVVDTAELEKSELERIKMIDDWLTACKEKGISYFFGVAILEDKYIMECSLGKEDCDINSVVGAVDMAKSRLVNCILLEDSLFSSSK